MKRIRVNSIELAVFERGMPRPEEPTLLFVHATGFHARIWDRIIESFDGYHVLALVDAAAKSGAFARLLLLDPTIASPESYANPPPEYAAGGTHPGAKRKRLFASPDEMAERLSGKGAYHLFEPGILRDYCRHGLEKLASGEFQLLCLLEIEASVYMTARANGGVHDSARWIYR